MAWKLDEPLVTLTTDDENEKAKRLWEGESLGGITENNAPLPRPVIGLLVLTILTAFAITFPLWGQRPIAALYADYIALMDTTEVQKIMANEDLPRAARDEMAMELMNKTLAEFDSPYAFQRAQHPVTMDDLRILKPQIIELQRKGVDLEEYIVVGPEVVKATFEGNLKPNGERERKQPWWDKGYHIAIWWIVVFCVGVMIAVKRLPHFSWQPDHSKVH